MCLSAEAMGLGCSASTGPEGLPGFVVHPPGDVDAITPCLSGSLGSTGMLKDLLSSLPPLDPPAGCRAPGNYVAPQHT